MADKIKVLKVEPHKAPEVAYIGTELSDLQEAVGGYIEFIYPENGVIIMLNEEGKLIGLEGNRYFGNDIIAGTFYVMGDDNEGDITSLPEDKIQKYERIFHTPDDISPEEVENAMGFSITFM